RQSLTLCDYVFQAEDGIRDALVTGVQTCALPILSSDPRARRVSRIVESAPSGESSVQRMPATRAMLGRTTSWSSSSGQSSSWSEIGRASCRDRVGRLGGGARGDGRAGEVAEGRGG